MTFFVIGIGGKNRRRRSEKAKARRGKGAGPHDPSSWYAPSSSPPNVLIGGPVRIPGFPLEACGNDGQPALPAMEEYRPAGYPPQAGPPGAPGSPGDSAINIL